MDINQNQKGFTVVEIVIVSGLSIMLMLAMSSLFMTFMVGNATTNMRKTVYFDGSYAINQMSFLIRNAISIDCTSSRVTLTSIDMLETIFEKDAVSRVASKSAVHLNGSLNLTGDEVEVTSLNFTCPTPSGIKYIGIDLQLKHKSSSGTSAVIEDFKTQVLVRN